MSEVTYVELSQNKSNQVNDAGDYTINLDKPLVLEQGDQLALYKSFIDTTLQQTEKIKLTQDVELSLSFVMYARNWWANIDELIADGVFLNDTPVVDNLDYIVMNSVSNDPSTDVALMTGFSYGKRREKINGSYELGGFTANFQYQDLQGNIQKINYQVPKEDTRKGPRTIGITSGLNVRCRANTFEDITPKETLFQFGIVDVVGQVQLATFFYQDEPPTPGDIHLEPFIQTVKISVPKGDYEPSVLTEFITTELTRIDNTEFDNGIPQGSPFLSSGLLLGMSNGISNGQNNGALSSSVKVGVNNINGTEIFIPISGGREGGTDEGTENQYIIGASQVALTFENNSIFNWEFLHTPFYVGGDGTTKSIGIEYVDIGNNKYSVVNKYGGIAFTDLSATSLDENGNPQPFDFWNNVLQMDVGSICVQFNDVSIFNVTDTDGNTINVTSTKLQTPLKDGKNTTGGLISIDETIDKTSNIPFAYTAFSGNTAIPSEISGTFGISATNPYDVTNALEFPYFRLDIECGALNTLVGEKTLNKNIFGIIGRYFELNTFNNGTSADSLIYVHKGEPIILSDFTVRILDSDGNKPDKLGNKNTVFLQFIKK